MSGRAHWLRWQKSCRPQVRPSHIAHYLQKEHLINIVSAYQAHHFWMDHFAVLPSLPTLPSDQEVDHCQVTLSKVVMLRDLQSCSGADDVYQWWAQAETITFYRQNLAAAPVTSRMLGLSTAVSLFNKQSRPNLTQSEPCTRVAVRCSALQSLRTKLLSDRLLCTRWFS